MNLLISAFSSGLSYGLECSLSLVFPTNPDNKIGSAYRHSIRRSFDNHVNRLDFNQKRFIQVVIPTNFSIAFGISVFYALEANLETSFENLSLFSAFTLSIMCAIHVAREILFRVVSPVCMNYVPYFGHSIGNGISVLGPKDYLESARESEN